MNHETCFVIIFMNLHSFFNNCCFSCSKAARILLYLGEHNSSVLNIYIFFFFFFFFFFYMRIDSGIRPQVYY